MYAKESKPPDERRIVNSLASEFHRPIEEVTVLYEHERSELALGARVTKFVHIFAIRQVQTILRLQSA